MRRVFLLVSIMLLIILTACGLSYNIAGEEEGLPDDKGSFENISELFMDSAPHEHTGAIITRFRTNDKRYWTQNGYTVWTLWNTPAAHFDSQEIRVWKPSGNRLAGYGLVLCYSMHDINGVPTPMMLTVMINNNGQYALGKVTAGKYEDLQWWKSHPAIRINAGVVNKIKVNYNKGSSPPSYTLWINENPSPIVFLDSEPPYLSYGRSGYIAVISSQDNFPRAEVDVFFERVP